MVGGGYRRPCPECDAEIRITANYCERCGEEVSLQ